MASSGGVGTRSVREEDATTAHDLALRVYRELFSLKARGTARGAEEAAIFALSWLVAGRLLAQGAISGFSSHDDLLRRKFWNEAVRAGLPGDSLTAVWESPGLSEGSSLHRDALLVTRPLLMDAPQGDWKLFDSVSDLGDSKLIGKDTFSYAYDANLCDLVFDLLGAQTGATVWLPFDLSGQLTVRAIRRGLTPLAFGPGWNRPNPIVQLLLLLEPGRPNGRPPEFDAQLDSGHRPLVKADYLVAFPPLGAKVQPGAGWRRWEAGPSDDGVLDPAYRRLAGSHFVDCDRTDSWTLAALWPAIAQRAVFMTLPNVLFAKGQEQRLRESLIGGRNVSAVIALPGRLVQGTGIVTALTVLDRHHDGRAIRMVDAADCTSETKSTMRFSRVLDAARVGDLAFATGTEKGISVDVPNELVATQDFSLMPSRYLQHLDAADQRERVRLADLVMAIRAPVASKEDDAVVAGEVGIPELDRWQAINGPFAKSTSVRETRLRDCALRDGDILVSIKGTIGKTGLVGRNASQDIAVVASQSCIALRVRAEHIEPLQLFLYLRSDDFKRQVEALKVGVSVAHITPTALLQDIRVPVPLPDSSKARAQYDELCHLESRMDDARARITELQAKL